MRNASCLSLPALATVLGGSPADASGQDAGPRDRARARVQPGDQIGMTVFREPEFTDTFLMEMNGDAMLPRLGRAYVVDQPAGELQENLRERVGVYLRNPVENVVLRLVGVHGDVRRLPVAGGGRASDRYLAGGHPRSVTRSAVAAQRTCARTCALDQPPAAAR